MFKGLRYMVVNMRNKRNSFERFLVTVVSGDGF